MAGYSATPLAKKLGIGENTRVMLAGAPGDYAALLEPLPSGVRFEAEAGPRTDVAHVFSDSMAGLRAQLETLRRKLRPDATLWVSWPKKASRIPTDVTEDRIREAALPLGWVDVKVCAVTEVWSGLKLVVRKELR